MEKKKENMVTDEYFVDGCMFPTEVKYDNTKYKIDFMDEALESFSIKRASDNKELANLNVNSYTPFITQVNKKGKTHFIIISGHPDGVQLSDYIDDGNELFKYKYIVAANIRKISDSLYLIDQRKDERMCTAIYNLCDMSVIHEYIYGHSDKDLRLDENYVMVVDKIVARVDEEDRNSEFFEDYLTYGIDLDKYEIVTPIYSSFHKNYFNMDSTECFEEAMRINAKTTEKRKALFNSSYNKEFGDTFKRIK